MILCSTKVVQALDTRLVQLPALIAPIPSDLVQKEQAKPARGIRSEDLDNRGPSQAYPAAERLRTLN